MSRLFRPFQNVHTLRNTLSYFLIRIQKVTSIIDIDSFIPYYGVHDHGFDDFVGFIGVFDNLLLVKVPILGFSMT